MIDFFLEFVFYLIFKNRPNWRLFSQYLTFYHLIVKMRAQIFSFQIQINFRYFALNFDFKLGHEGCQNSILVFTQNFGVNLNFQKFGLILELVLHPGLFFDLQIPAHFHFAASFWTQNTFCWTESKSKLERCRQSKTGWLMANPRFLWYIRWLFQLFHKWKTPAWA